LLKLFL